MTDNEKRAFEKGITYYQAFCDSKEGSERRRDCLEEAYRTMLEHSETVEDFYYKLIFSLVVDEMQASDLSVSPLAADEKTKLFDTLFDLLERFTLYRPYLWTAMTNMAKACLREHDDAMAKRCYELAGMLGFPLAGLALQRFSCCDGEVRFLGKRSE